QAIVALVSDDLAPRDFYQIQNDVLSTTNADFLEDYQQQGLAIETESRKPRQLTEILNSLKAPSHFDLLSIDTEEHDLQVLRSLDLNVYHPRLIVVEDESFDPLSPDQNKICGHLSGFGYRLEGYVLKILYFMRAEPSVNQ